MRQIFKQSLAIILTSLSLVATGQTIYDTVDPANQNTALLYGIPASSNNFYWMEFFNLGTVKLQNGAILEDVQLNYDPVHDNLLTKRDGKDFIIDKKIVDEFSIYNVTTNTTYLFKQVPQSGKSIYAEQILTCPQFTLYKKNSKRVRESAPQAGYGSDTYKGKSNLIDQSELFIHTGTENILVVRNNTELEKFLVSLGAHEDELEIVHKLKKGTASQDAIALFLQKFCIK